MSDGMSENIEPDGPRQVGVRAAELERRRIRAVEVIEQRESASLVPRAGPRGTSLESLLVLRFVA